jgi:hypothetical protein
MVARDGAQPAIELARLIHELLEARPDGLGDPQRFVRAGSEHDEQWCDHQREQQHERRDGGQCPTAPEVAQQPLIHGVAQSREDGRQQDRQQKRADHGHERHRDRRDHQQQKGLAEARLCHGLAGTPSPVRDEPCSARPIPTRVPAMPRTRMFQNGHRQADLKVGLYDGRLPHEACAPRSSIATRSSIAAPTGSMTCSKRH